MCFGVTGVFGFYFNPIMCINLQDLARYLTWRLRYTKQARSLSFPGVHGLTSNFVDDSCYPILRLFFGMVILLLGTSSTSFKQRKLASEILLVTEYVSDLTFHTGGWLVG